MTLQCIKGEKRLLWTSSWCQYCHLLARIWIEGYVSHLCQFLFDKNIFPVENMLLSWTVDNSMNMCAKPLLNVLQKPDDWGKGYGNVYRQTLSEANASNRSFDMVFWSWSCKISIWLKPLWKSTKDNIIITATMIHLSCFSETLYYWSCHFLIQKQRLLHCFRLLVWSNN